MLDIQKVIAAIKKTIAFEGKPIPLHEPFFSGNEWHYIKTCLDTGWVSSVGQFVDRFEADLAAFTGAQYAIATMNGTAALHMCYQLAGVKPGDEVLLPALTFVATANAVSYCGAVPHFVDADLMTLGIDIPKLDAYLKETTTHSSGLTVNRFTNRPLRALCLMHTLGHPANINACIELCQKYKLVLIEDAAEALGSYYQGTHVGHFGQLGAISFNGNKILTTGGGGAILTNDAHLAKKAKHLTTTAKLSHPWAFMHDSVAYNYRLPNINAALGLAQLEKIDEILQAKRTLMKKYQAAFLELSGSKLIEEQNGNKSNYWLNALLLEPSSAHLQVPLLVALNESGILSRPLWNLLHTLPMYTNCPRMSLTGAESLMQRIVSIPSSPQLILSAVRNHTEQNEKESKPLLENKSLLEACL